MKQIGPIRYQVNRRRFLRDATLTSIGLMAVACIPGQPPTGGSPTPGGAVRRGGEFHGAWPYELPPAGHWNGFAPKAILTGFIYGDLWQTSLGVYRWADDTWTYWLAESSGLEGENYEVKLRSGLRWSDGTPFSSKDVETTFLLGRLAGFPIWQNIDSVDVVDDTTISFHITRPSSISERHILRTFIRPDSQFGEMAQEAKAIFAGGGDASSAEGQALRAKLNEFRPDEPVSVGPYKIDVASMNEARVDLVRNEGGYAADTVNFDKIVLFNGETAQITPLVLAGDVDYATHGFPLATDRQFVEQGFRVIRAPLYSGPALFIHWEKAAALQDVRLRQAIAYAEDRQESGTVTYGDSAQVTSFMTGFSDNIIDIWISADDQAKLNKYEHSPSRAEELIQAAGYTKGSDGVYARGADRLEFELIFPTEFADWASAAQHLTDSLNRVGFRITQRGVTSSQHIVDVNDGNFQLAIRAWGNGPHPQVAYIQDLRTHNTSASGGGMAYPLQQTLASGQTVNLDELINRTADGFDTAAQKAPVTELALAFNELLPIIPIWERKGNNPVNTKDRVTGWLPEGDPIYQNSHGTDSFTVMQIMDGTLRQI
ncbi:MAG: ABC transporter substrate-binding protein [Candidatus Limnocylindria bacterium]